MRLMLTLVQPSKWTSKAKLNLTKKEKKGIMLYKTLWLLINKHSGNVVMTREVTTMDIDVGIGELCINNTPYSTFDWNGFHCLNSLHCISSYWKQNL